jgi:DNA-binding winged helix-turn-helix (wHTH) protein/predicted ATPase
MRKEFRIGPWLAQPSLNIISKEGVTVHVEPKVMEVLVCLAQRAGELVRKEELMHAVWPATFVTDDAVKRCVSELRRVFDDDPREPRFIETIPKRGYRMIAAIELTSEAAAPFSRVFPEVRFLPAPRHSVGRGKERAELAAAFESAAHDRGVLVCVTGEPGIGKTTLVQDFISGLQASGKTFDLAIGRCSQRLAGEEAYLPFLEALDSLLRYDGGLTQKLRQLAPSWYAQLFPLSESDASDVRLQEYVRTTTQERVKREFAAFICEITRQKPLVLFFDDVHWTDPSTVDLLSHLATKFDSTRILVIVTYRPSELLLLKHPFAEVRRGLQAHSACWEIEVEYLSASDVERYIALEFLGNRFPREFAGLIHARTEGNPLFMVDLLRYLRDRKVIAKTNEDASWHLARSLPDLSRDIPQSVGGVIERKIDQLSDRDQEVLRAAAVQGYEFDSGALAQALEADSIEIEDILDRLERVHAFVKRVGEGELSGAPTVRYRFVHVLYQNALYTSLTPTRRVALSTALAHALESIYSDQISTIASQLAFLYETARDPGRASDYFLLAARNAQRIFANKEAIALARHGLALLDKIPESPERTRKELDLQITLAFSLLWTLGYAAPETGANMARARELCLPLSDAPLLFPILCGLWLYYLCKGDMKSAREAAEHLLSISRNLNDPVLLIFPPAAMAFTLLFQGELIASRKEFDKVSRLYNPAQHVRYVQLYRIDPGLQSESESARALWLLGFPGQARRKMDEALALASKLGLPLMLAGAQRYAAMLYQNLRQPEKAKELGEACIALCLEHGMMLEHAWVECPFGWAIAELGQIEEGISHIRTGLDTQLSLGAEIAHSQFQATLAETLSHAGRTKEALQAVEDGLAVSNRNRERYFDAELWRLKGEFSTIVGKTAEAEPCFQKALEIAEQQAAKSLELRAGMSLARLWQKQGKRNEAQQLLGEIYSWFAEGFDTADLREAESLLKELSRGVEDTEPVGASRVCDNRPSAMSFDEPEGEPDERRCSDDKIS